MSGEAEPLSGNDKLALTVIYQKGLNLAPVLDADFGYRYPDVEVIVKIPREETITRFHYGSRLLEEGSMHTIISPEEKVEPYFTAIALLLCGSRFLTSIISPQVA